jgi:hypothetical protein
MLFIPEGFYTNFIGFDPLLKHKKLQAVIS